MLIYRSPAKINLTLDIIGVRPDGYHELQSVVHCIGLYDTLSFDFGVGPGFSLRCNRPELVTDDNLCLRASRAWLEAARPKLRARFSGVRITLDKNIPTGGGLGGGSSNAATTLLAMNEYFDHVLNEDEQSTLAAHLGADVPLFLQGGCMLIEGIGERVSTLPALNGWVAVIVPNQHASTPAVYRRFDELGAPSQRSTPALLDALHHSDSSAIAAHLGNDLQDAAQSLGIDVQLPLELLNQHGALGAQMSGSGSASFGLFTDEAAALQASEAIRSAAPQDYKVFTAPLINDGIVKLEAIG